MRGYMTNKERTDIIKKCCDAWNKLKDKSDMVEILIQEKFNNFKLQKEVEQLKKQLVLVNEKLDVCYEELGFYELDKTSSNVIVKVKARIARKAYLRRRL